MDTTRTTAERAARLIRAVCGEDYGDGYTVTDVAHDYAEPGYRLTTPGGVVVFGNWNPARWPRDGEPALTLAERAPDRLAAALENIGADVEWCDEWTTCAECYRALRTEADSYRWTMYGAWIDDHGYVCSDCLREDLDQSLEDVGAPNNARYALTFVTGAELAAAGWTQWEAGDAHQYESGWHPGQDDDPAAILAAVPGHGEDPGRWADRDAGETVNVVFLVDAVGQFDCRFSAWTRPAGEGGY